MSSSMIASLRQDFRRRLVEVVLPFWLDRAINLEGGYFVDFPPAAAPGGQYLVPVSRLVWAFSRFSRSPHVDAYRGRLRLAAAHGRRFLESHFYDPTHGGWYWAAARGAPLDDAKVLYGQVFAIYALAEFARTADDSAALELALDTYHVVRDRFLGEDGSPRVEALDCSLQCVPSDYPPIITLDTTMHLLEALTELYVSTGSHDVGDGLFAVRQIICDRMIDPSSGSGWPSFDDRGNAASPQELPRTWLAERNSVGNGLVSYGHNAELAWLLGAADQALGYPGSSDSIALGLLEHTLEFGIDWRFGGIFRSGPLIGPATDRRKEFWQNAEALVGLARGLELTGELKYLTALQSVHDFAARHLAVGLGGEWVTRTSEDGRTVEDSRVGSRWKVCYHTGRALLEADEALQRYSGAVPEVGEFV